MQTVRKQSTNCTDAEPLGWGNGTVDTRCPTLQQHPRMRRRSASVRREQEPLQNVAAADRLHKSRSLQCLPPAAPMCSVVMYCLAVASGCTCSTPRNYLVLFHSSSWSGIFRSSIFNAPPKSSTLDDLERPLRTVLQKRCIFQSLPQNIERR